MICTPLSVSTTSLISPTFRAMTAFSKGFCILPLSNGPTAVNHESKNVTTDHHE
jgi:hypothetical protein